MRRIALAAAFVCANAAGAELDVKATPNTARLMPCQVFELTFQHEGKVAHPTWDVAIDVALTPPSGKAVKVGGFFYGSSRPQTPTVREWTDNRGRKRSSADWPCDPADLWKARYAPSEIGEWAFAWTFRDPEGQTARGKGTFRVVQGRVRQKGWVRIHPQNPFRFVFEDGSPFYPVGWQDGVFDNNHNGSAMDAKSMEGPFRLDNAGKRPKPAAARRHVRPRAILQPGERRCVLRPPRARGLQPLALLAPQLLAARLRHRLRPQAAHARPHPVGAGAHGR